MYDAGHTELLGASSDRAVRMLKRCRLLDGVSDGVLHTLASGGVVIQADRRSALRGTAGTAAVFVVGSGRLRVLRRDGERELTLDYLGAGDLAGEATLSDPASGVELVASEAVEALAIPPRVFLSALERAPGLAVALLHLVAERRARAERRIQSLLDKSVESRVVEFLLFAAERHGVPDPRGTLIGVKFTHQEIASFVGSTRETVTLVLGDLKRAGCIGMEHRRVVVTSATDLRARL